MQGEKSKDIKRIGEGVEQLISFFHLLSSMGYSKEQAKEGVLDALDFAYKETTFEKIKDYLVEFDRFSIEDDDSLSRWWEGAYGRSGFNIKCFSDEIRIRMETRGDGGRCMARIKLSSLKNIHLVSTDTDDWFEDDTVVLEMTLKDGTSFSLLCYLPEEE